MSTPPKEIESYRVPEPWSDIHQHISSGAHPVEVFYLIAQALPQAQYRCRISIEAFANVCWALDYTEEIMLSHDQPKPFPDGPIWQPIRNLFTMLKEECPHAEWLRTLELLLWDMLEYCSNTSITRFPPFHPTQLHASTGSTAGSPGTDTPPPPYDEAPAYTTTGARSSYVSSAGTLFTSEDRLKSLLGLADRDAALLVSVEMLPDGGGRSGACCAIYPAFAQS